MTTPLSAAATPLTDLWQSLGAALSEQEQLLETLLFKLDQEHMLLVAARTRWLGRATQEVLQVNQDLARQDELRRAAVDRLVVALGLPATSTLSDLVRHAPEGWSVVLAEHRQLMCDGVARVQEMIQRNRAVLSERLGAAAVHGMPAGYGVAAGVMPSTGRYVTGAM